MGEEPEVVVVRRVGRHLSRAAGGGSEREREGERGNEASAAPKRTGHVGHEGTGLQDVARDERRQSTVLSPGLPHHTPYCGSDGLREGVIPGGASMRDLLDEVGGSDLARVRRAPIRDLVGASQVLLVGQQTPDGEPKRARALAQRRGSRSPAPER